MSACRCSRALLGVVLLGISTGGAGCGSSATSDVLDAQAVDAPPSETLGDASVPAPDAAADGSLPAPDADADSEGEEGPPDGAVDSDGAARGDTSAEPEPDTAGDALSEPDADADAAPEPDLTKSDVLADPDQTQAEPDVAEPEGESDAAEAEVDGASDVEADGSDGGLGADQVAPVFGGVVSAEALGETEVLLTWDGAEDDASSQDGIVYEVCVSERRVAKGGCQPWVIGDESAPGVVEHVVAGLEPNTRYFFVVRARDEAGNVDGNLVEATALTPGNHAAKAVAVGGGHACALMARGTVRCWGDNDFGQLGDGTQTSREVAAPVLGLELVKLIAAGAEHTCAAIADGTVRCWGRNDRGQLGDGTTEDSTTPVVVTDLGFVKALSPGDGHTCAILGDGTMRCWGANDRGQLGDGTFEDRLEPVEVSGAAYVKDVACGAEHTCAVAADGLVACWGRGDSGQLGHGDADDRIAWTTVEALQLVTDVAAGGAHSCARSGDGTVMCWGANDKGQLGSDDAMDVEPLPIVVPFLERVSHIAARDASTCVRVGDGTLRCWGAGSTESAAIPGLDLVDTFDVGANRGCARRADGRVECWELQAAFAGGTSSNPIGLVDLAAAIDVSAGAGFACALLSDGTARCWGSNLKGELGNWAVDGKTTIPSALPVKVADLTGAVSAVSNYDHTCGIIGDGGMRCWGQSSAGHLGSGVSLPVPAYTPSHVWEFRDAFVTGGGDDPLGTCAGRTDGRLYCWGPLLQPFVGSSLVGVPLWIEVAHDVTGVSNLKLYVAADGLVYRWTTPTESVAGEPGIDRVIYFDTTNFQVAVRGDGSVWPWGLTLPWINGVKTIAAPTQFVGFADITRFDNYGWQIMAGLRSNGRIQTWGQGGADYKLGVSDATIWTWFAGIQPATYDRILEVELIDHAVAMSVEGYNGGCAVIADGRVKCWGRRQGDAGKLPGTYVPWEMPYLP
jgi:alpha-tubulin suppressor-like RCC1 family protein